jgi:hypothetical protein
MPGVHTGWFPAQKADCQCNLLCSNTPETDIDSVISTWWEDISFFNVIIHALMLHTWHWRKLKNFTGMCSSILPTALDYHLFGPWKHHVGASTIEMTRQLSRPCLHSCRILKWSSITCPCSASGNTWIVLEWWWDNSSNWQHFFVYMYLCFNMK